LEQGVHARQIVHTGEDLRQMGRVGVWRQEGPIDPVGLMGVSTDAATEFEVWQAQPGLALGDLAVQVRHEILELLHVERSRRFVE
jgi:hypothetical protein